MLFKLLGLPLTLPAAGIRFVFDQVLKAAEAEMTDDAPVKEALLLLQLRLEEGDIDEEEYVAHEAHLMQRLREIRAYREERLTGAGREALFPLWGRDTTKLAHRFIDAGFEATLVSVDPSQIDASFAGRAFDEQLLADLPASADPCGENGEFHTFVHAGPIFDSPIPVATGETVVREGFVFTDIQLA